MPCHVGPANFPMLFNLHRGIIFHGPNKPSWPPRTWPVSHPSHLGRGQLFRGVDHNLILLTEIQMQLFTAPSVPRSGSVLRPPGLCPDPSGSWGPPHTSGGFRDRGSGWVWFGWDCPWGRHAAEATSERGCASVVGFVPLEGKATQRWGRVYDQCSWVHRTAGRSLLPSPPQTPHTQISCESVGKRPPNCRESASERDHTPRARSQHAGGCRRHGWCCGRATKKPAPFLGHNTPQPPQTLSEGGIQPAFGWQAYRDPNPTLSPQPFWVFP